MRYYEIIYIVNPNLNETDYGDVLTKFNTVIEKLGGIIVKKEEWGIQRLAYELNKLDKGKYVLLKFCGEPKITGELERELKLDDRILLFQTVKLSDHVNPDELMKGEQEVNQVEETEEKPAEEDNTVSEQGNGTASEVENGIR